VAEVSAFDPWSTLRPLGRRGPAVTGLGLGCAPIGNLFTGVSDADASATVDAAWEAGIRYFDTAPLYGHGASELRLGRALKTRSRTEYVLSTKVGRVLRPAGTTRPASVFTDVGDLEPELDFSRDGILRSLEESLARLGTDHIDVVLVHDPDDHEDEALRHAFPTLLRLRDEGVVTAVGCGMNQTAMLERFLARVDLDCLLLAGRYSLLDRSGAELLAQCAARDTGVILGGVFNAGVLIDPAAHPTYDYAAAPSTVIERARRLEARFAALGIALGAAALRFAMQHPAVTTVLVGARSAAEVDLDVGFAASPIDHALFADEDISRLAT
jgi:aryl-alcohol dehydrogenase-like predicted oxidoreductase